MCAKLVSGVLIKSVKVSSLTFGVSFIFVVALLWLCCGFVVALLYLYVLSVTNPLLNSLTL